MELVNETALIESTAGTLRVTASGVAVFPSRHSTTSLAAWYRVAADWTGSDYRSITYARGGFPAEIAALIHGVLYAGNPIEPLMDWVIEYGPPLLAHHVERVQAAILARTAG